MIALGVKKLRTTGYNPKANGLCEKVNGIVKQYLLKYVNLLGGEWDQYLHEMSYAYNSSIHTSTGFSPAELMFGRKLRTPLDILYGWKNEDENIPFSIRDFKVRLHNLYELANEMMNTRQEKYLNYHDKKVYDDVLPVDCLVYLYLPRKQRDKMDVKWVGPCKVISVKHPVYHIGYQNGTTWKKWITRDKLRRCEISAVYPNAERNLMITNDHEKQSDADIFHQIVENENNERERNNSRYNLRRRVNMPDRYGENVTH